jgi:hypothetical protein
MSIIMKIGSIIGNVVLMVILVIGCEREAVTLNSAISDLKESYSLAVDRLG